MVVGCIDHHEDEHAVATRGEGEEEGGGEPRIVEKAGSCTSLVLRYCQSAWEALSASATPASHGQQEGAAVPSETEAEGGGVAEQWDSQLAKMALASILVDTGNLQAKGRVEEVDRWAVTFLEEKIRLSSSGRDVDVWDRGKFYEEIDAAKRNIDHLTLHEILSKDYKFWDEGGEGKRVGISSAVKPLRFLVDKGAEEEGKGGSGFEGAVEAFMEERGVDVFAVMTTFSERDEEGLRRELLLQARGVGVEGVEVFVQGAGRRLGLEGLVVGGLGRRRGGEGELWREVWRQGDAAASRKVVAPLLRGALRGEG